MINEKIETNNSENDYIILLAFSGFELVFDKDGTDREEYTFFLDKHHQYSIAKSFLCGDEFVGKHFKRFYLIDDYVFCFEVKCNEIDFKKRIEEGFKDFRHKEFTKVEYVDGCNYADLKCDVALLRYDQKNETVH